MTLFAQLHTLFPQKGLAYGTEALLVGARPFLHAKDRGVGPCAYRDEPNTDATSTAPLIAASTSLPAVRFPESLQDGALLQLGQAVGMTPCVMLLQSTDCLITGTYRSETARPSTKRPPPTLKPENVFGRR